jgi:4-amino-4-deoxy-L-arabinose transferase-like glycosyltransferase
VPPAPLRRRRLGLGLLLLAGVVLLLMAMPLWRERQLRQSCEQGHGRWESNAQRCVFGTPPKSSSNTAAVPEPK